MSKYCNRYMDDAPGIRGDCERHLKQGRPCEDCPSRDIHTEVADLRAENATTWAWREWGEKYYKWIRRAVLDNCPDSVKDSMPLQQLDGRTYVTDETTLAITSEEPRKDER